MPWASYQCSFTRRSLAIAKSHRCNTLQLAPAATTVSLSKKRPDLNTGTCCDGFDVRDSANDIEFHRSDSGRGPTDWQVQVTILASAAASAKAIFKIANARQESLIC